MAVCCPACRSDLTQALGGLSQCVSCGAHFGSDGTVYNVNAAGSTLPNPTGAAGVVKEPNPVFDAVPVVGPAPEAAEPEVAPEQVPPLEEPAGDVDDLGGIT